MKIGILTPYADPEKGAPIARITFFKEIFVKNNIAFEIFVPKKNFNSGYFNNYYINRYKNFLELLSLIRRKKFDLLIATSPPATIIFNAALIAKILNIPLIADVRDPWVKSKTTVGLLKKNSPKFFLHSFYERICYCFSNKIFVVTPEMQIVLNTELKVPEKKMVLIPHPSNLTLFNRNPVEGERVRKELNVNNKQIILIYVGNAWVGIDQLVRELKEPILKSLGAKLLLILSKEGDDKHIESVLSEITNDIKNSIHIIYNVPQDKLFRFLSAADIGLSIIPDTLYYVVASKTKEYGGCSLPIACKCPKGASFNYVMNAGIGIAETTWPDFIKSLALLIKSPEQIRLSGQNDRELMEKNYSIEAIGKKVMDTINSLKLND